MPNKPMRVGTGVDKKLCCKSLSPLTSKLQRHELGTWVDHGFDRNIEKKPQYTSHIRYSNLSEKTWLQGEALTSVNWRTPNTGWGGGSLRSSHISPFFFLFP